MTQQAVLTTAIRKQDGEKTAAYITANGLASYENNTYIKWIDLTKNGLTGRLPNFWKIRNLQGICLQINKEMTGTISSVISSNMTRLRRLCLSYSGIYGKIPWDLILQLPGENTTCCMNEKKLHGTIPQNIDRLLKLQVLSFGKNDVEGDLPFSIRNLRKLWFLEFGYVKLNSGEMWYFSNMSQLIYLHLTICGLAGTLPNDFGKTHVRMFDLHLRGDKLRGEIKNCFNGFQKITQLILGSNKLHGLLPSTLIDLFSKLFRYLIYQIITSQVLPQTCHLTLSCRSYTLMGTFI